MDHPISSFFLLVLVWDLPNQIRELLCQTICGFYLLDSLVSNSTLSFSRAMWVSWRPQIIGSCISIHSINLFLLITVLRPFTLQAVIVQDLLLLMLLLLLFWLVGWLIGSSFLPFLVVLDICSAGHDWFLPRSPLLICCFHKIYSFLCSYVWNCLLPLCIIILEDFSYGCLSYYLICLFSVCMWYVSVFFEIFLLLHLFLINACF